MDDICITMYKEKVFEIGEMQKKQSKLGERSLTKDTGSLSMKWRHETHCQNIEIKLLTI